MQVSASSFAQRITLSERNASLQQILKKIKAQSGFDVIYLDEQLDKAGKINLQFKDLQLAEALGQVFKGQPLSYEIKEKTIVIKEKTPSFLDRLAERWATVDIRGKVVGEDGAPIAGANVSVKGMNKSAITDQNGVFYISGVDENSVLVISYIGYSTKEVAAAATTMGNIILVMSSSDLNEVEINKGYYTEKRRLSTGSVGRVTADEISRQPISNPLAALYGRVSGLVITQTTGVPGGNFEIQIRGQNSLRRSAGNNGNTPLYLIDGVPFNNTTLNTNAAQSAYPTGAGNSAGAPGSSPFNSINPADIESIEVLKDADATAIYGSRGANGVILITTKKGKNGQMQVDASVYTGAGKVTRKMELLNTDQYLEMRKEAYKNDGITTYPANAYDVNGTWDHDKYTDWQKELIGGTARNTDAQLAVSGGSANTQYRFGGGYHKETTVFPGDFSDQRASGHLTLNNTSLNKKFRAQLSVNYAIGTTNLFVQDLTLRALTYAPNAPDLLDGDSNLSWPAGVTQNPLQFTKQPYDARTNNLVTNASLSYALIGNLILKTNMGYTTSSRKEVSKIPIRTLRPNLQASSQNTSGFGNSSTNSWVIEPQLDWHRQFNKSRINALVGGTFQDQNTESLYQFASGFNSEALMDNISAVPNAQVSNSYAFAKYRYSAVYARLNYDYGGKYLLNLTGRRDASSRFGPGRQFANFAAAGVAWIFSEEEFIKNNVKVLSFGKLRSSYGTSGSDQTPNYAFLDLYSSSTSYDGIQGLGPTQLYNPDFGWEENRKLELALELGFLKDKIMVSAAWFRNRSSNQLAGYPLPSSTGFGSIPAYNLDAVVQNKGFEFELNTHNITTNKFKWSTSFNVSFLKNKLVSYPNLAGSSYASTYVVGEPLAIAKTYEYLGVNPATGFYQVKDADNNGIYNTVDLTAIKFLGPRFSGGFGNSLNWKGFQLDFLFQFVKQDGRNYLTGFGSFPGALSNQPVAVMARWENSGDQTNIQKFSTSNINEYLRAQGSTAAITDASFIRLKNTSLSYALPSALATKAKLKGAKIYMQGQNLLTITNYKGLDPETQGTTLPPLFFVTTGIQLTF